MAYTVTVAEVKLIIDTDLTDPQVEAFIATANTIVSDNLGDSDLSDATLEQIETWLTAHLITARDRSEALTEQEIGDAREKYSGKFGLGLDATRYGQTVKQLDTTGILNTITLRKAYFQVNTETT